MAASRNASLVRTFSVALLGSLVFSSQGCERESGGAVVREGEPGYTTDFDADRMSAAIAEAKQKLETFVEALRTKPAGSDSFLLKKGFKFTKDGKEQEEFIWLSDVQLAGDGFEGKVDNKPVHTVGVKVGESVRIGRDEVADWMFTEDGKLRGGYTIVALAYGTDQQAQYERQMGIDWSRYEFLRK